tara:strand:+ start:84 stop:977 length:894 start_codon:yes stop_codon:yes gene_type:complete
MGINVIIFIQIRLLLPLFEIVDPSGLIMPSDSPAYSKIGLNVPSTQMVSIPTQEQFIDQMVNALRFFFGTGEDTYADLYSSDKTNFGFKGFVLAGPPGSGKTEAVTEAGRRLWLELADKGIELELLHINSADINRSGVGDMEQRLRSVFTAAKNPSSNRTRTILLFDDIDTLLMSRDDSGSKEWHQSLNGVFFHELDTLRTDRAMICATTNKEEKLDDAVKSRLTIKQVPAPSFEEMLIVAKGELPIRATKKISKEEILAKVTERMKKKIDDGEPISFRLARKSAYEVLMNEVVGWE